MDFIHNILETRGRFACGEEYHERHHIEPRCMGGSNDENNLIDLYAHEHFIAHKLLAEENPDNDKLTYAHFMMAFATNNGLRDCELTPEEYEEVRTAYSNMLRKRYENKENHPSYGTHISEDRKRLIGNVNRGNKYCVGREISEETRKKIGDANRNPSEETRKKMSEAQKIRDLNGARNPRAKQVIRLSDNKIYGCAKDAASDNGIKYSVFKYHMCKNNNKDFMYYKEWLQQNNLENKAS